MTRQTQPKVTFLDGLIGDSGNSVIARAIRNARSEGAQVFSLAPSAPYRTVGGHHGTIQGPCFDGVESGPLAYHGGGSPAPPRLAPGDACGEKRLLVFVLALTSLGRRRLPSGRACLGAWPIVTKSTEFSWRLLSAQHPREAAIDNCLLRSPSEKPPSTLPGVLSARRVP
jgi:hypothetical protein